VQAGGGATEVQLLSDGYEVPQMTQLNIDMPSILMQTNKILDVSAIRAETSDRGSHDSTPEGRC